VTFKLNRKFIKNQANVFAFYEISHKEIKDKIAGLAGPIFPEVSIF
jgi:ribosomal protein S17E